MSTFIYNTIYNGEHPYFCTKIPIKDSPGEYIHFLDALYLWRGMLFTEKKGKFWPVPRNLYEEVEENLFDWGTLDEIWKVTRLIEEGLASVEEYDGMIYRNRVSQRRIMDSSRKYSSVL